MTPGLRQTAIEFESDGQAVQGVFATPADGRPPYPGAVVCHAHPLFGGNMDSAVTYALCRALASQGVASLRFNFRPFGEGATEPGGTACEDIEAALRTLRSWPEARTGRCGVAGFSAGAAAIARGIEGLKGAKALVLISPPLSAARSLKLGADKRPRLIIAGGADKIAPPADLLEVAAAMARPCAIEVVRGADHTLRGREAETAEAAAQFLGEHLRK